MDPVTGELGEKGDICYCEDGLPMVKMTFRSDIEERDLFIDAIPCCTDAVSNFDMVMETIIKLTEAGIIEIV